MRNIITQKSSTLLYTGTTSPIQIDDYKTRLLKLIPTEIIGAYIAIESILKGNEVALQSANIYEWMVWGVFAFLLVLTPIYLKKYMKVDSNSQLILSTIAFAVWVFSMGGPFLFLLNGLTYIIGAIVLVLYTMIVPIFYK